MDDVTETLHDTSINENVENTSVEKKPTNNSWLDQFITKDNKNNVNGGQEKSHHNTTSSNGFGSTSLRGRGRGLSLIKKQIDQNKLFNHSPNSNVTNDNDSLISGNHGRGRGYLNWSNINVPFEGKSNYNYNNRSNRSVSTSSNSNRHQEGFRRSNGENGSFRIKNNSFNDDDGGSFASDHRGRIQRSFERSNDDDGGSFASDHQGRIQRSFERSNGEDGSFRSDTNKRLGNNNNSNFAFGHRGRNQDNYYKRGEQSNNNNSSYGNNDDYTKKQQAKLAGPKKEYIPPDIENDENIAGIVAGLNFDKYNSIAVKVSGTDPPKRMTSFKDSGLREVLLKNLSLYKFSTPTPVQMYAIPVMMAGRDLMASAQTGSGKTAAFVLPVLHNLVSHPVQLMFDENHCEPQAIIIAPTRELVIQINECVWKFSKGTSIKTRLLYGGASPVYQKSKLLESGVHVLCATPGRLLDFVQRGIVTFSSVKFVVLDEADRMLEMGFKSDIESMLNNSTMAPCNNRQTVMYSATFPRDIQELAIEFLKLDYIFVAAGEVGEACKDVIQTIKEVRKFDKKKALLNLLKDIGACDGTIVFVEQKRTADFIATFLGEQDFPTTSIHGAREQEQRELALKDFKSNKMKILVGTAVAARGLDIKGVNYVVNYDLPKSIDEYVHRIGRTGRLGNSGKAFSFFDPDSSDRTLAPELVRILKQADQEVPKWLSNISERAQPSTQSDNFNDIRTNNELAANSFETEEEEW